MHEISELRGGDVLFLVSCSEMIGENTRSEYTEVLVLHSSNLPEGRGWSPHIWAILNGMERITLSLLNAEDSVDSGAIWAKIQFHIPRTALFDEINARLFEAETQLMSKGIRMIETGQRPVEQPGEGLSYWPKRTPADSEVDPSIPLEDQFDQIRVADPNRYPAYCYLRGKKFILRIERSEDDQ